MGDAFSNAASSVGAAVVNGLFANAQAVKSYKFTRALQQQAAKLNYDYSQKSAKTIPRATRYGLEKAGYNPMLAVQNATAGANSSWTSAQSGPDVDYTGAISSGIANAQSFQRLKNETAQSESVVQLNDAISRKNISEAINNEIKNSFLSDREVAEIGKIRGETAKLENDIAYNNAYLQYLDQSLELQEKLGLMGNDVQQVANANQAERNRILEKSMPSGRSQSFSNYAGGVRNLMSGIGDIIHGRNDYENFFEERQVINGPKGRSSEKVTSRRSGKRKKR